MSEAGKIYYSKDGLIVRVARPCNKYEKEWYGNIWDYRKSAWEDFETIWRNEDFDRQLAEEKFYGVSEHAILCRSTPKQMVYDMVDAWHDVVERVPA